MHRYTAVADDEHGGGGGSVNEKSTAAATFASIKSLAQTALLMVFSGIAGALIFSTLQSRSATGSTVAGTPEAERLHNLLSFPSETVKFVPNKTFTAPPSPQTDDDWMGLLGPARGFIALDSPERYGLAPGRAVQGDAHQVYGVTMFHQLHCLIMIRDIYYGLLNGTYIPTDYDSDHLPHCFDFLQQSIRCAGLVQIEIPRGSRHDVFDGYGSDHTCRSWSSIMEFMEEYQAPQRPGGGPAGEHEGHED